MDRTVINENPTRKEREDRNVINFEVRAVSIPAEGQEDTQELYVEGYACVFNQPTVLYTYDGVDYQEQIDEKAFDKTDMSDVIFNYNHGGKVLARTRNKTLELRVDAKGLFMRARLDGTEEGKSIYNDIKNGYIDRMSYSYTVQESSYDSENHIRTIRKLKKLYDVSAVDIPAYEGTSIDARNFDAVAKEFETEKELSHLRRKLIVATYL